MQTDSTLPTIKCAPDFDFTNENPQSWLASMERLRNGGHDTITTRIYWGAHEKMPGIRDFSKASRLKLEKFLTLTGSLGLSVDLIAGFFPARESFPDWAWGRSERILVPASIWTGMMGPYELVEIPSYRDPEVQKGFLSFLSELVEITDLYRKPEGPINSLKLDLGVFACEQSFLGICPRYETVKSLNDLYRSSFHQLSSAFSVQGWRTLFEKRAWLAAYDYREARSSSLSAFWKTLDCNKIQRLETQLPLPTSEKVWILAESTLVDQIDPNHFFPLSPGGEIRGLCVNGSRLINAFADGAKSAKIPFALLSPAISSDLFTADGVIVVLSGKYMVSTDAEFLKSLAERGYRLFFPLNLPQYDEKMGHITWTKFIGKQVITPKPSFEFSDQLVRGVIDAALSLTGTGAHI